ncbi:M1 family metallopeptidase [Chryseobacterium sp. ISL-6]|uniref:M1 family metallopeptidase n=1 Tax=Chryseobacterium sp. ISL-6 TaxID=2819143 RepID=UPI002035E155|nr:M1 family metallopeptidase [Chryseobacterium sp. ISL-6]
MNDQNNEITATAEITYTNNSPDKLSFLWLQLDQNVFTKESRYYAINSTSETVDTGGQFGGGYQIQAVKLDGKDVKYAISDTRMQIDLPKLLKGNGGVTRIKIDYSFVCPKFGLERMGVQQTAKGKVFAIGQWFPRMCVYDDVSGWNTLPYLGVSEFYVEYGNIKANITVPANQYVVASGKLLNEKEMYNNEEIKRWKRAKNSDKTINIRQEAEFGENKSSGTKTWKFKIEKARDFAWASSSVFVIDAARINLSGGKKAIAISAYPPESGGEKGWAKSVEYTKAVIEHNSQKWYDYVYPSATNVAATRGGMEYPGIVFCSWGAKGEDLRDITNHEFGHNWFPIIVGSNERLFSWMDEGFNTFLTDLFRETSDKGMQHKKQNIAQAGNIFMNNKLQPIMVGEDNMDIDNVGILSYHKPGIGLKILRELILGPEKFDKAFKTYIRYWAFKHPTPWDFFIQWKIFQERN